MKISMKRIAALVVALVMVIGLVPVMSNTVDAVALPGLSDSSIGLSVGADKWWSASENTITGSITGVKRSSTVYMNAADTLKITNTKPVAATLSFDFAVSGYFNISGSKITIDGTDYTAQTSGSFSKELAAGGSIEITISAARSNKGINTLDLEISKLSLLGANAGPLTTTFEAPAYGSYTVAYGAVEKPVTAGSASVTATNESTVEYTLIANPGDGYKFVGWYNVTTGNYLSTATEFAGYFDAEYTIKAVIVPEDTAVFMAGKNYYTDLNAAAAYATANSIKQITLVQSGTLEAVDGGYTIPAGITLLIPRDDEYTATPYDKYNKIAPESTTAADTPVAHKTLTMAEGASLTVNGIVDVEALHTALQGAANKVKYGGRVSGGYGAIYMSPNSTITVNNGGSLYAFGYVYGNGSITANSGAKVYEIMQVNDFPGGENLSEFVDKDPEDDDNDDGIPDNDYLKTFPFSQYYVQNIEVALTLMYGASEYIFTSIHAAGVTIGTAVEFIGSNGMFIPASGSITKDYDPSTDRLIVDVDGDASVSSIVLDMAGTDYAALMQQFIGSDKFDSSRYILNLNSNITINVNSGTTTINQDVSLLPGVRVNVAKRATLEIAEQVLAEGALNNLTPYGTGGHNVYVWDLENYGKFAYNKTYMTPVSYSPTVGFHARTYADLEDALVDVNGTVISNGFLYSTVTFDDDANPISGGAAIISSGKTGQIVLQAGSGEEDSAYCLDGTSKKDSEVGVDSVWLKNGNGTFVLTEGAAAGTVYDYCARHDQWYTGECGDCATPDSVEITWIVNGENGTDDVAYGTTPVYPGGTPTKAADGCTAYTFAGWSTSANGAVLSELPAATEDAVYYAIFTSGISHTGRVAYSDNGNGTHDGVYECCDTPYVTGETCKTDAEFVCQDGNCQQCGAAMAATEEHGSDYYCDKNCNICGEEIWPDMEHEQEYDCDPLCQHCCQRIWPDAQCVSDALYDCQDGNCIFCSEVVSATEDHDWLDADCETAATCNDCGETSGDALGHGHTLGWGYDEYEDYHDVVCLDCNAYSYEEPHDYDDTTKVCDCGRVKRYTVIFMNGDTEFGRETCAHGGTLNTYGMPVPTAPEGYSWDGWYTGNGVKIVPGMSLTEDVVAFATFKLNSYQLTVVMWDGSEVKVSVPFGTKLADLAEVQAIKDVVYIYGEEYKTLGKLYGKFVLHHLGVDGFYTSAIADQTMPAKDIEITTTYNFTGWLQPDGIHWTYLTDWTQIDSGWMQINEADYTENGTGSAWYYFEPTGEFYSYMVTGISRVPYPTMAINGITYAPNAEDVANAGDSFIDKDTGLFLFDENGKFQFDFTGLLGDSYAVNGYLPWHYGLVDIDGQYFYFIGDTANGGNVMVKDCDYYVGRNTATNRTFVIGGLYTFGADGAMCMYEGITNVGGTLRYYEDAQLMAGNGLTEVGENIIYVNSKGNLIVDAEYYVGANGFGIAKGIYYFDENGFLVIPEAEAGKNGFYFESGNWYYYVDGAKGYAAGLINTNGILWYATADAEGIANDGWVYVKSNGALVTGIYYVSNTNGHETIVSGTKCTFDDNGIMIDPVLGVQVLEEGGIRDDFYARTEVTLKANGKLTIDVSNISMVADEHNLGFDVDVYGADGSYYSESVYGEGIAEFDLPAGEYIVDIYIAWFDSADDDEPGYGRGSLDYKITFTADGTPVNGIVDGYYYVDGQIAYGAGLIEINGIYYYVRSNGQIVTDCQYWITNVNDTGVEPGLYEFDIDGWMHEIYVETFTGIKDGYFYIEDAVAYGAGLMNYNGGYIYVRSNGQLTTGKYWITNHNDMLSEGFYDFGEDGYYYPAIPENAHLLMEADKNVDTDGFWDDNAIANAIRASADGHIYIEVTDITFDDEIYGEGGFCIAFDGSYWIWQMDDISKVGPGVVMVSIPAGEDMVVAVNPADIGEDYADWVYGTISYKIWSDVECELVQGSVSA